MRIILLFAAFASALVLACAPATTTNYAQPAAVQTPPAEPVPTGSREIVAEGVAAVIGSDKGIARDHAIEDAKRKAVEQGVGSVLKSETEVKNYQLVYDKISTRATGYVSSYTVLSDEPGADLYRITIRAVVKMADLESDVSGILNMVESQGRPRIMVLIRDTREGTDAIEDPGMASDLETMVIDGFVSKGFPVVDAGMVKQNLNNDQVKLIMDGDDRTAALLGARVGAEIVIAGKASASEAQKSDPYTNQVRDVYSTRLNCRAVNTATSEILTSALVTKDLPYNRDASRKQAAEDATDKMVGDILKKWQTQDIVTQIYCTNADNERLKALQSALNTGLRGVKKVMLRDFTGNLGVIEVLAATASQEVYDRLNTGVWNVPFKITGFSGNRIDLEFVPK